MESKDNTDNLTQPIPRLVPTRNAIEYDSKDVLAPWASTIDTAAGDPRYQVLQLAFFTAPAPIKVGIDCELTMRVQSLMYAANYQPPAHLYGKMLPDMPVVSGMRILEDRGLARSTPAGDGNRVYEPTEKGMRSMGALGMLGVYSLQQGMSLKDILPVRLSVPPGSNEPQNSYRRLQIMHALTRDTLDRHAIQKNLLPTMTLTTIGRNMNALTLSGIVRAMPKVRRGTTRFELEHGVSNWLRPLLDGFASLQDESFYNQASHMAQDIAASPPLMRGLMSLRRRQVIVSAAEPCVGTRRWRRTIMDLAGDVY